MEYALQAIATLFSLVNPMVCAMMFTGLTADRTTPQRIGDLRDLGWQGEDDVEIFHRQQVLGPRVHPVARGWPLTLRAVPVLAGIVSDVMVAALGAPGHMPAERFGPAGLDRRHHLELGKADMPRIGPPPRGTMGAEDVSNLQLWPGHPSALSTPGFASPSDPAAWPASRRG